MKIIKSLLIAFTIAHYSQAFMDKSPEMLPRVKIFQEFTKACPRVTDRSIASLKGIVEFSSEPEHIKKMSRSLIIIIEEAKAVQTEEQAQKLVTTIIEQFPQYKQAIEKEIETLRKDNPTLPYIKIVQQVMIAFPLETQSLLGFIAIKNLDRQTSQKDRMLTSYLSKEISALQQVKTEEDAQMFLKRTQFFLKTYK